MRQCYSRESDFIWEQNVKKLDAERWLFWLIRRWLTNDLNFLSVKMLCPGCIAWWLINFVDTFFPSLFFGFSSDEYHSPNLIHSSRLIVMDSLSEDVDGNVIPNNWCLLMFSSYLVLMLDSRTFHDDPYNSPTRFDIMMFEWRSALPPRAMFFCLVLSLPLNRETVMFFSSQYLT